MSNRPRIVVIAKSRELREAADVLTAAGFAVEQVSDIEQAAGAGAVVAGAGDLEQGPASLDGSLKGELRMRRRCGVTLAGINRMMGDDAARVPLEDALHELLADLAECCEAERALLIGCNNDRERVHLLAASDDRHAARLPLEAAAFPELAEIAADGEPQLVTNVAVTKRVAAYGGSEGEETCTLFLLPLRDRRGLLGLLELHLPGAEATLADPLEQICRHLVLLVGPRLRDSELYRSLREQTRRISLAEVQGVEQTASLGKYEEFFRRSFDGIAVIDNEDRVTYINPAAAQITGFSKEGIAGTPLAEIVVEHDRAALGRILADVRGGSGHSFEIGLLTTSGDPIVVSAASAVLTDQDALVLSFRDVTEARALADELRATKEFLERLIDSTVDAIIATDKGGAVVLFNRGAERLFGLAERDVVGHVGVTELFPEGVASKVLEQLHGESSGGAGRLEVLRKEIVNQQGEIVPVSLSASLIYEDEIEVGTVYVFSDLRDRLRIERRLEQAQEQIHSSEKQTLIAELAGTTAHELNQPLTSVMGFAELLKKKLAGDASVKRAVDTLVDEAERMADIVRKIGRITKYETKDYVGGAQILDLDKSSGEGKGGGS